MNKLINLYKIWMISELLHDLYFPKITDNTLFNLFSNILDIGFNISNKIDLGKYINLFNKYHIGVISQIFLYFCIDWLCSLY